MLLPQPELMQAEKSVLGSVLIDNNVMDEIGDLLEERDFSIYAHQLIWKAMKYMYKSHKPIDIVTITEMLMVYKRLEETGGVDYLTQLTTETPTSAHARYYAELMRSRAIRQRAIEAAEQIKAAAKNDMLQDDEQFLGELDKLIEAVKPENTGDLVHVSDARKEYFDYLNQKDDLIPTGFRKFDEWMGGLGRGWLYILAARPSVGKTAKMLQMLRGIAAQGRGHCLVWSQEMKRNQLFNRMIASITGIPASKFRLKRIEPKDWSEITKAYDMLERLPIHIADAKNVTIDEVKASARKAKRKYGQIAAIFIDYLGIMNIPQPNGMTRAQAVGEVTKAAKRLAMELDCVVILLAQMNREGKKAVRPSLEHLRESGDIEQDADIVEFLWDDPNDQDPGQRNSGAQVVKSIIAKGRDVGVNEFRYAFKSWIQRFEEADR